MKCTLGFCDEFPKYIIPDEELYNEPNYSLIHFSVYTYQERCEIRYSSKWTNFMQNI